MENDYLKLRIVHLDKNVKHRYNELSDIQNDHTQEVISLRSTNKKLRNQIIHLKVPFPFPYFVAKALQSRIFASKIHKREQIWSYDYVRSVQ